MTRVRTHHEFVQRPVWDKLGAEAFLLHHAALAYVNAHATDGLLPKAKVRTLHSAVRAPYKQVGALLREEMWTEPDDEHYRVCDVQDDLRLGGGRGDEQPSAAYIEKEQERARAKKEAWKERRTQGKNPDRNPVPSRLQGSAGQDRTVQDSHESSPAPRSQPVEEDCEHGIDRYASCADCARERKRASA